MQLQPSHFIALGASAIIALWMTSGTLDSDATTEPQAPVKNEVNSAFAVQVERFSAKAITPELSLNGETRANRHVDITSEVDGKVEKILAREGDFVKKGQLILQIDQQDKPQKLKQAKALVNQRTLEFKANQKLIGQGLQNQTRLAESESLLEAAKAQVKALEVAIAGTQIRAPFAGILENRQVELGSYLRAGHAIISIMDYNPFVIQAFVAEKDLAKVKQGTTAKGKTLDGQYYSGTIRYVSSVAYQTSRAFSVELEINNPSERQANGITAEILIPLNQTDAIFVSPALLSLNEQGVLGAKHVNAQNVVEFTPVELVKAKADGVWISGLPNPVDLIVTGQSFVSAGEKVKAVFKQAPIKDISGQAIKTKDKLLSAEAS
ncbi:MAG: efflux RND transporter periplasmic adaptor subunit [Bermanella sp.]